MDNNSILAPHETLELHELMSSSVVGAKKLNYSMSTVEDNELKCFMQNSLNAKKYQIEQMQSFINSHSQDNPNQQSQVCGIGQQNQQNQQNQQYQQNQQNQQNHQNQQFQQNQQNQQRESQQSNSCGQDDQSKQSEKSNGCGCGC